MAKREFVTLDRLRGLLSYDPDSGEFTWLVTKSAHAVKGTMAGSVNRLGYVYICIDYRHHEAHRLAFLLVHGWLPIEVDHIDRDPGNNRIANLRAATHAENHQNKGLQSNNRSGCRGVCFCSRSQKWMAYIKKDQKMKNLGLFDTIFNAVAARRSAENRLFTHGPVEP